MQEFPLQGGGLVGVEIQGEGRLQRVPGLGCWVEGSELDPGDPAGEECVRRIRQWNQILVCRKHGRLEHRGWSRAEQERS